MIVKLKPKIKSVHHILWVTYILENKGSLFTVTHLVSLVGWGEKHHDTLNFCTSLLLTVMCAVVLWGRSGEGPGDKALEFPEYIQSSVLMIQAAGGRRKPLDFVFVTDTKHKLVVGIKLEFC